MAIELETTPQEYKAAAPTLKGRTFQVHETYRWTLNGNNGVRKYVPYIYLKEYKLTQSGEISSLRNSLASIQESTLVRTVFGAQLGAAAGTAVGNFFGRPGRVVGRVAGRVAGAASGALGADGEFLTNNLLPGQEIHYLSPYDGLYPAVETGFEYYLPYLNIDNMTVAAGNWSTIEDSTAARTLGQVLGLGSQLISESGSGYLKQLGDLLGTAKKAAVEKMSPGLIKKVTDFVKNSFKETPKIETKEATTSSSVGAYDAPGFEDVKMKGNNPTGSGISFKKPQIPGGGFVKVKEKCKKFPYCNQGDINAIKITKPKLKKSVKKEEIIKELSEKHNIDERLIEKLIRLELGNKK